MARLALIALLAACGDNADEKHLPAIFAWDGQREVGAYPLDGLTPEHPVMALLPRRYHPDSVVMLYAHVPGDTISYDLISAVLDTARREDLPLLTFADLAAGGPARSGICLSFDDNSFDAWYAARDLLHGAHVTFFVTEYADATAAERGELHALAADGHDIEAHGVHHLEYTADPDAYVADEVLPSFDILRADGFAPVAFAYPGGARTIDSDRAILAAGVAIVRGISTLPH